MTSQNCDTAKLQNEKVLNEAGKYLEQTKFGLVVISASAGLKGDSDKEQKLTEARSFVVRDYLVKTFKVDDTRIKTLGLGEGRYRSEVSPSSTSRYTHRRSAPLHSRAAQTRREKNSRGLTTFQ